jgi:nucleotide-binding universal stress UspA family protein
MRKGKSGPRTIRKILIPSDFSDGSERAVEYAELFARSFGAKILLVHAIEPFPYSATDSLTLVDHSKALATIAASLLENQRKPLLKAGLEVRTRVLIGLPASEILRAAAKEKADLIVMGTHGRSGLGHLLVGSVAEKVVRMAKCPVMTVRGEKGAGGPRRRKTK